MQQPLILAAFDVRHVDQPDASRVHIISKMSLPSLKRKTIEHMPGGGIGQVDFVLPQIEALEPKFETRGPDLEAFTSVGLINGAEGRWIFAGAMLGKRGTPPIPLRAIIQGTVAEIEPGEGSIGDAMDFTHSLQQVDHYEIHIGDREMWYWDAWEREGRSNGVSWYLPFRQALGI